MNNGLNGFPTGRGAGGFSFSGCRAYRGTSAFTIPDNTLTAVEWNGETFDTDTYHSADFNPERLTVPVTGTYRYSGLVTMVAGANAAGYFEVYVKLNGATLLSWVMDYRDPGSQPIALPFADVQPMAAGDYLTVSILHEAGVGRDVTADGAASYVTLERVG